MGNFKIAYVCIVIAAMLVLGGCRIRPGELAITERDKAVYVDPERKSYAMGEESQYPLAILVNAGRDETEKAIYAALDAALTDSLSQFTFFTIKERSNLGALQKEMDLESLSSEEISNLNIPEADFLITAKMASTNMKKALFPQDQWNGEVSIDYRFYEKAEARLIFSKNIMVLSSSTSSKSSGPGAVGCLVEAAQKSASEFAVELGKRYAPEAVVVETRGEGRVAKINLGNNYGVAKSAKVEFYEYVDNSAIIPGAVREPSPVGYGMVLVAEKDCSWVEILNHKKVKITRGHYAKLSSDQSKGAKEMLKTMKFY